jgi:hypothetical protein
MSQRRWGLALLGLSMVLFIAGFAVYRTSGGELLAWLLPSLLPSTIGGEMVRRSLMTRPRDANRLKFFMIWVTVEAALIVTIVVVFLRAT